ncbi:MAG: galactose oxidase-like domain-containing protein, partial [Acidimicrobiales bacterium]
MEQAVKRAVGCRSQHWLAAGLVLLFAAVALVATQPTQADATLPTFAVSTVEETEVEAAGVEPTEAEAAVIANDPFGAWSEVGPWPLVAIHAAVLDNGKVLSYTGTGDTLLVDIWDPSLGLGANSHSTFNNTLGSNLFCSFTLDDPNSENKLLVGGEIADGQVPNFVAQYGDNTLSAFQSMNEPRWYPTVTTLWDGRLLAQGGTPGNFDNRDDPTPVAEVYSPDNGWQLLEGTRDPGVWDTENYGWWYPKSHVTPSGKVWNLAWDQMYYIDPDGAGAVDLIDTFAGGNRGGSSSSVMYDTGLVLQIGGGERGSDDRRFLGSNAATIFNLNYDPPILTEAAPMNFGRHWADATVLPDGRVLVTGGSLVNNRLDDTTLPPEIWDPKTDSWTVLTGNNTPRLYHSTTLLMPDGSVLTAGGGKSGPVDNFNGQLFYPPYLYDADGSQATRPTIEAAPRNIEYNQSISVTVDGPIDRVTLIKQSNSTHSMNSQIFSELSFSQTGSQLSIETPDYATVATPGEYLLFVLDSNGVPSVSRTVRLTGVGLDPPPPLEPLAATVTGLVDRVGGGAVAGVSIDLFEATADGARGQWLTSTATDSDGTY